jgi:hypothetical protein
MSNQWSLREEILSLSHRWPIVILFCLAGTALGWGASRIWPSPHEATAELYVAINVYRALDDRNVPIKFNYADDYKNWQMANLNTVIFMDPITQETLNRLRQQDPYWNNVSRDDLVSMLHVYWRNAGKWRLVADNSRPKYASQAVQAWRDVILEQLAVAIQASQKTMEIDNQLRSVAQNQARVVSGTVGLQQTSAVFKVSRQALAQLSSTQVVGEAERQKMLLTLQNAGTKAEIASLSVTFPPAGSSNGQVVSWLDEAIPSLDTAIQAWQARGEQYKQEQAQLSQAYAEASKQSLGFSANLQVEPVSLGPPALSSSRPTAILVLVGAAIGLLAWLLAAALYIMRKTRS